MKSLKLLLLILLPLHIDAAVFFTHIVNHTATEFTISNSPITIPAYGFVDLEKTPLCPTETSITLIPDNDTSLEIIISAQDDAGLSQLHPNLTNCWVHRKHIFTMPSGKQWSKTTRAKQFLCSTGNNILEITNAAVTERDPSWKKYLFNALPTNNLTNALQKRKPTTRFPLCTMGTPSPFTPGGMCCKTPTDTIVPGFAQSGTLCQEHYISTVLYPGNPTLRDYVAYLPFGYFDNPTRRYPVLFYLHGTPSEPELEAPAVGTVLDLLIASGRIEPMIVIFPNGNVTVETFLGVPVADLPPAYQDIFNDNGQLPSYWANSIELGNMEDDVVFALYDFVDATYRTKKGKQFKGMNGFSGGGGSHQLVLPHTDRFGSVSSDSGFGVDWPSEMLIFPTIDALVGPVALAEGFTYTHMETLFANDPLNVANPLSKYLADIYNESLALSPDPMQPYGAPFPIDANGMLIPAIVNKWTLHSATFRAAFYQPAILKNNLMIFFDAGGFDFFYNFEQLIPREFVVLFDVLTLGGSYYNFTNGNYSDILTGLGINHDFVSYRGNHNSRSTLQSISSFMFHSAVFLTTPQNRAKIMGTGELILRDSSTMVICDNAVLGIESDPTITSTTILNIILNDAAKLQVGNDDNAGGTLQIGNPIDPIEFDSDINLQNQIVSCTILLDGPQTELQINRRGILGFGVGVQGHDGTSPNESVVRSLENVKHIGLALREGILRHNQILPGDSPRASLFAIGPCETYTFSCMPLQTRVQGGGNMVKISDALKMQPIFPRAYFQATRISATNPASVTYIPGTFAGPVSQGIRDIQEMTQTTTLMSGFFNQLVSLDGEPRQGINMLFPQLLAIDASFAHKDKLETNILSSQSMLFDANKPDFPTDVTQDEMFAFLKVDGYDAQAKKRAPLSNNGGIPAFLVYLENRTTITGQQLIVRLRQDQFPLEIARIAFPDTSGISPNTETINRGLQRGAVGILLNAGSPRILSNIFDLEDADEFESSTEEVT